jgi:hypothetical protein
MDASYTTNVLPTEILEAIMDQLHTDIRMLGICGLVCMEWLTRSRYHLFSAIRLSPCRARRFFELCRTKLCTFVNCVNYIDVDCAERSEGKIPSEDTEFPFCRIFSLPSSLLTHIKSLSIRHINWTSFSPSDQNQLRQHLASFTELHTLELDNVMFHDLREIVQITSSYPHLNHIVVNVQFSKYMEYAISSAAALALPSQLETLQLCADEAIPVLLNTTFKGSRISRLILDGVKLWHLPHIGSGLQNLRDVLQHLQINFSTAKDHSVTVGELTLIACPIVLTHV